jgi:hypothetical protein
VCLVDPAPGAPWRNNYGVWVDEFEALGYGECFTRQWPTARVVLDDSGPGIALQRAYAVLSDESRRAHYDQHGTDGEQDHHGRLLQELAALFLSAVQGCPSIDSTDIFGVMRDAVNDGKRQRQAGIAQNNAQIAKLERALKRVKKKTAGQNLFADMLAAQIGSHRRGNALLEAELAKGEEMLALLADYEYQVTKAPVGARGIGAAPQFGQFTFGTR